MKRILIINGPNLNLLGRREPEVYGSGDFPSYLEQLSRRYPDVRIEHFQSNVEGLLIDRLHAEGFDPGLTGIILNAGAYTHTSIALHDAIKGIDVPVIEVHISNVFTREEFRHRSMISAACRGVVAGFGLDSYRIALEGLLA